MASQRLQDVNETEFEVTVLHDFAARRDGGHLRIAMLVFAPSIPGPRNPVLTKRSLTPVSAMNPGTLIDP